MHTLSLNGVHQHIRLDSHICTFASSLHPVPLHRLQSGIINLDSTLTNTSFVRSPCATWLSFHAASQSTWLYNVLQYLKFPDLCISWIQKRLKSWKRRVLRTPPHLCPYIHECPKSQICCWKNLAVGTALVVTRMCTFVCNARYVSTIAPPDGATQNVVLAHYAEVHYESTVPLEEPRA